MFTFRAFVLMTNEKAQAFFRLPETSDAREQKAAEVQEVNADSLPTEKTSRSMRSPRTLPPFVASHDIPRGCSDGTDRAKKFFSSRRTFQAAYIISIVVGLGIGEVLFGRIGGAKNHMLH
ncbi:hypothetical protein BD414DRAFT_534505 [Trametes punicea]|nr:hypothetical protein BD414DRAFT_534505 [Trametes punicea]